jgi:hypothetical protein
MPIVTLSELRDAVPRGGRLMGLDLGSKTIGLALSDAQNTPRSWLTTSLAHPDQRTGKPSGLTLFPST